MAAVMETADGEIVVVPLGERAALTGRQRNTVVIATCIANDIDTNGTPAEQHTAALLHLVADAVTHNYEAELVRVAAAWRRSLELGKQPGEESNAHG